MSRRILAASISMVVALMTLPSAQAVTLPTLIHCSASGSGVFFAGDGFDYADSWSDIVATGTCAAKDSGKQFTVTLTGAGQDEGDGVLVCCDLAVVFYLDATLTNIQNGHSKTYSQNWNPIGWLKWVIQSNRISLGYGTVKFGTPVSSGLRQYLSFAWTFLVFHAP